jgi:hypothetical protein
MVSIYCIRLFLIGDHPEIQFESGNLEGGNYPCPCGCKVTRFTDIAHVFRSRLISPEERRKKVRLFNNCPNLI